MTSEDHKQMSDFRSILEMMPDEHCMVEPFIESQGDLRLGSHLDDVEKSRKADGFFRMFPGWWFRSCLIFYMGCHPNPIEELHDFSGWLKHVKTTNQFPTNAGQWTQLYNSFPAGCGASPLRTAWKKTSRMTKRVIRQWPQTRRHLERWTLLLFKNI